MPGIRPRVPITPAATPIDLALRNIWPTICWPTSSPLPTRETTMAAATEISKPGICATSASPKASRM